MATLTFFKYERVIQVDSPQTSVGIQDLINQIRNYEEELINLDYGTIANAYGKQTLGGGAYIGITLELINNWRLSFEARPGPDTVLCFVSGGNLVAINDYDNNPIYPTAFTQVNIAQSTSPSIIQAPTDYATLYMLESLKGRNKRVGSIWYWNPTAGNDVNDGTTPATAVATFAQAQTLATPGAGAGDIIFAITTVSGGVDITEVINITVDNLKVRGPGYPFRLKGTLGSDTVTIGADNVELSGFYTSTQAGGTDNGITITGDAALIQDVWVESATGNGIDLTSSSRTNVDTCAIENCTGNGINIGASTNLSMIRKCIITGNANGVSLSGSSVSDNIFETNLIFNNTGNGIGIASGVTRTGIRLLHTFAGNGTNIADAGTGTFQDTSGTITSGDIDAIVNGVWDEVIGTHVTAGTTGKTLKDAKTKATLASLK